MADYNDYLDYCYVKKIFTVKEKAYANSEQKSNYEYDEQSHVVEKVSMDFQYMVNLNEKNVERSNMFTSVNLLHKKK